MDTTSSADTRLAACEALLARIVREYPSAALASGFGAEGMVLIDVVSRLGLPIRVFTLDTGRLPQETYELMARVRDRYGIAVETYFPETESVERFVREHGPNAFYESRENRRRCCAIRKTEPLQRALAGASAWVTGLRRGQGVTRRDVEIEEFDDVHGLLKFNPLAQWSDDDVWTYLRSRSVPWNALHDRGYPSIGCAPCTRAVETGEDARAGRWWWEQPQHRECGLHRRPIAVAVKLEATP
jgi:phosphoadenosine phosphosulfate reductase